MKDVKIILTRKIIIKQNNINYLNNLFLLTMTYSKCFCL